MKLLANENFPIASVYYLREKGFDIISISEGLSGIMDRDVMELAQKENRLVLTFDRDYGELIFKHNLRPEKGVLYLRLDKYEPDEPGRIVEKLLIEAKIASGRVLTVFDGSFIRQRKY